LTPEPALPAAFHGKDHDQGEKPGEKSCHGQFLLVWFKALESPDGGHRPGDADGGKGQQLQPFFL
jgi:hypothetical protein